MPVKKKLSLFLIIVFVLQLLPVRQAVRYFWVDNLTVEELAHTVKSPVKPPLAPDEDHYPGELYPVEINLPLPLRQLNAADRRLVPSVHADDVETPPPNHISC